MTSSHRSFLRRGLVSALSALLAVTLLGSCNNDKAGDNGPGSAPQDEGG